MTTARRPPPGPPSTTPPAPTPISPAAEYAKLGEVEAQSVQFIEANEAEQKRAKNGLDELQHLVEKQQQNLEELRGFRRPVVNLVLYRTIRQQVLQNKRNADTLATAMAQREQELRIARDSLVLIRSRRTALERDLKRGQVIPFKRKP